MPVDWSKDWGEIQWEESHCPQCGSILKWNREEEYWEECEPCLQYSRLQPDNEKPLHFNL